MQSLSVNCFTLAGARKFEICPNFSYLLSKKREIRTFETLTPNALDLNAIPVIKKASYLPIVVDPSHATGARDPVTPISVAALMFGDDSLLNEVHQYLAMALSDQSLKPVRSTAFLQRIRELTEVLTGTY